MSQTDVLEKEIKDLKEQLSSQYSMFEMTVNHLQKLQEELRTSEKLLAKSNKKLLDSIHYSKNILDSFLLKEEYLQAKFPNSFIIHTPKDIIGGDFAWLAQHRKKIFLGLGDCTGHGVPAAMLTIFMISTLNQIFNQNPDLSPANLIIELDKIMKQYTHHQFIKDTAELGILCVDIARRKAIYSGAKRPLVVISNKKLTYYKGARFYPGNPHISTEVPQDYYFKIPNESMLYLFSDGVTDQFGGENHQKFSEKKLLDLFFQIHLQAIDYQKNTLLEVLTNWQGNNSQTDDKLILGIKF
ncbi:MAG: serine/threonine-protein phosphatase [Cytophagales bacterium]|nr:serine/threonine-protein phosphatase [Cytophagales bacterium]MDW8384055.1 PP2C family protein-serine/threonine phosphatase [Flammeovirgaceae bacterium]